MEWPSVWVFDVSRFHSGCASSGWLELGGLVGGVREAEEHSLVASYQVTCNFDLPVTVEVRLDNLIKVACESSAL